MMKAVLFAALMTSTVACAEGFVLDDDSAVIVHTEADAKSTPAIEIAVERLKAATSATVSVTAIKGEKKAGPRDILVELGVDITTATERATDDYYEVRTVSQQPLTLVAAGSNDRSMLYAAYQLADLIKSGQDMSTVNLSFKPRVKERYVSFGATTHGRREYRPDLYWKTLNELPLFGYNGVIIYPGGGTPIGRHSSPITESKDGAIGLDPINTARWKDWLAKVKSYDMDIMMTVPPTVPAGYSSKEIRDYYAGGPEPKDYLKNLKSHFEHYLELLTSEYPETDLYMFNSTEGATFGRNQRFFGHPNPGKYPIVDYLRNNDAVMTTYFDVLKEHFGEDLDKVMFWTHSFGLSTDGIRKMREILFRYPEITIIEDDFWNNNTWPHDLPAMAYLPDDLRAKVSESNPFALFQIVTDGEYYGGGSLPNVYPDSHIRSVKEAMDRGARMVIQRLDLHDRTPYGTAFGTMELVPLAASKQMWEPTPPTEEIWSDWAVRRFGKAAAPRVISALQESKVIMRKGLSCNGVHLLGVGSEFMPRMWMKDKSGVTRFFLFGKPGRDFVPDDQDVITSEEFTAYQMDTHSIAIAEWRENQAEAAKAVERGISEIQKAKSDLISEDYDMLNGIYMNARHVLKATRLLGEAAYATNIVLDNFDKVEKPDVLFGKAIDELEAFLGEDKLIPEMRQNIEKIVAHYKELAAGASADGSSIQ